MSKSTLSEKVWAAARRLLPYSEVEITDVSRLSVDDFRGLLAECNDGERTLVRHIVTTALDPSSTKSHYKAEALARSAFPDEQHDGGYVRGLVKGLRDETLKEYYGPTGSGRHDRVRLELPVRQGGGYEPRFVEARIRRLAAAAAATVLFLALIAFVSGTARKVQADEGSQRDRYDQASTLMSAGRHKDAEAIFSEVIHAAPSYTNAWYNRGACRMHLSRWSEAIDDFTTVLDREPTNERAVYNRAVSYMRVRDLREALQDFSAVIALNPSNLKAYRNRVRIYSQYGETEKANSDLQQIEQLERELGGDK